MNYDPEGKRIADLVMGAVGLAVSLPLSIATAVGILAETGRPVLFKQERIGRNAQHFTLLKFRSMTADTPDVESSKASSLTVTKVGQVIRRLNIDEIPQLWSVVKGDMSLIGPRPALPSQQTLLGLREQGGAARLRPGLTGLAQVNSYDGMEPETKAAWDNDYAAKLTWKADLIIMFRTVSYLLKPPPVY